MYNRIDFVSKKIAENITPNKDWIIISINEADYSIANLKDGWLDKLVLVFDDIDSDLFEEFKIFNKDDAKNIIDFVEKYKEEGSVIIVHCHAGISRSSAVAKFIAEKYNLRFNHNYFLYNKLVYTTLKICEQEE